MQPVTLANIDTIEILQEEPTAEQNEYINIPTTASTSNYKLYFKSK